MDVVTEVNTSSVLVLRGVNQRYCRRGQLVPVLSDVNLRIERGETCALVGTSGSGKSTLLNILGLLESPASGQLIFAGQDLGYATPDELAQRRNRDIGFVFQSFNLLPRLTALDNVALPLSYRGLSRQQARACALEQLIQVGLADRVNHKPADLSGGQRQRVAIARALVGQPMLILADEPTGNLDNNSANEIMSLLLDLNRQQGVTLVMVTHDTALAARFDRQIRVVDGTLQEVTPHADR